MLGSFLVRLSMLYYILFRVLLLDCVAVGVTKGTLVNNYIPAVDL